MFNDIKRIFRKQKHKLKPEGEKGIEQEGYRAYVGGMWDEMGKLQFDFLVEQGLKPSHCFLDIACGSLRGGVHFINYLDRGNYLGIDKERDLIDLGIEKELGNTIYRKKEPEFIISDCFEFHNLSKKPQFSLAQSLFTHLNTKDIRLCLNNLKDFVDAGHIFFATFFEGDSSRNPKKSHSHRGFDYSKAEMEVLGRDTGWKATYIGNWKHPRKQMMIKYEAL